MLHTLPAAPDKAYDARTFRGRVGAYAGQINEVRWGYYKGWSHGQIRRAFVRKRWFQVVMHEGSRTWVVRLQDNGTIGNGRILVFDRESGGVVALSQQGAPLRTLVVGPNAVDGTNAFLRAGGADIRLTRDHGGTAWHLVAKWAGVDVNCTLESAGAPTASLVIGEALPPLEHRPGLTQRSPLLRVSGTATVDGHRSELSGALAELTYTNVFLPRFTRATTVSAHGRVDEHPAGVAFTGGNLLGTQQESTLFFAGKPHDVGRVELVSDLQLKGAGVDLTFTPQASHHATETRMGGLIHHHSEWAAGELTGTLQMPNGTTAHVRWPALREYHHLLR